MGDRVFSVYQIFPHNILEGIQRVLSQNCIQAEEIRVRLGQPVILRSNGKEYVCSSNVISAEDISHMILNATNGAFHTAVNTIQNGYLILPDGCRMGFCGEGAMYKDKICNIRHVSSICIRISNELYGCADEILPQICQPNFRNTIIIGPPGSGKTTLLREIIRKLSEWKYYIAVVDERGELSGMNQGKTTLNLGTRVDISYGIPKQQAAMMMLRTMSPDILAMDEITARQDMPAILEAIGCGVGLLTTIHGNDFSSLAKPSILSIIETNAFETAILIDTSSGKREYRVKNI